MAEGTGRSPTPGTPRWRRAERRGSGQGRSGTGPGRRSRRGSHTGHLGLFSLCALCHLSSSPTHAHTSSHRARTHVLTLAQAPGTHGARSCPDCAGAAAGADAGWRAAQALGQGRGWTGAGALRADSSEPARALHGGLGTEPRRRCPSGVTLNSKQRAPSRSLAGKSQASEGQGWGTPRGVCSWRVQRMPLWSTETGSYCTTLLDTREPDWPSPPTQGLPSPHTSQHHSHLHTCLPPSVTSGKQ